MATGVVVIERDRFGSGGQRLRHHGSSGAVHQQDSLALQLHIPFDMSFSSAGLMCASPDGPSNDVGGIDPSLRKADGDATDFLDRPADQWRRGFAVFDVVFRRFVFGGGVAFA
jgi:hypothetical protein